MLKSTGADMRQQAVFDRLKELEKRENLLLSPVAIKSTSTQRRRADKQTGYRQNFAVDADRILHSKAYTRYIDKTQVFSLITNDHITHRVLHVQLVSRIARTIGRALYLNEDLIEAIALGHDIGHPPFGHEGERFLSKLCEDAGIGKFYHNLQSVRSLEYLEKHNTGCNLCLHTLDGILCHDGESRIRRLKPSSVSSFVEFDTKFEQAQKGEKVQPASLEGCVVRLADTIAYLGRDIEDAIILNIINREDIPDECAEILGTTNGTIVHTLVTDLLTHSVCPIPGSEDTTPAYLDFSAEINNALHRLKSFNYKEIYLAPQIKKDMPCISKCYTALFHYYCENLTKKEIIPEQLGGKKDSNVAVITRDFIAGMTDDYFLAQAAQLGCTIPEKKRW